MDNDLTDEQLERFALMVEHLPPDEAQRAYEAKIEAAKVMAKIEYQRCVRNAKPRYGTTRG